MRMIVISLGAAFALAIAVTAEAADCCAAPAACMPATVEACDPGCLDPGGCGPCARKVCKVVVEMKKVKKHVWVVECEEHCPSLPGSRLLGGCRDGCCGAGNVCTRPAACGTACGTCDPCATVRAQAQAQCPPRCGHVRCRKVLKKKEIECEVPTYKCVVVCQGAGTACPAATGSCVYEPSNGVPATSHPGETGSAPLPPVVGTAYLK